MARRQPEVFMRPISPLVLAAAIALPVSAQAVTPAEVLTTYADIAEAGYADSLSTAQALQAAIEDFLAAPSAEGLEPPAPRGAPPACLISRPRPTVSATRSSTIGKAA
jgi:Uncharacterized iron-regulated protein